VPSNEADLDEAATALLAKAAVALRASVVTRERIMRVRAFIGEELKAVTPDCLDMDL
jgi:hypothetical protein